MWWELEGCQCLSGMPQFVREEGEEDVWDAVEERESLVRSTVHDNGMGRGGWRVATAFSHPNVLNWRKKTAVIFFFFFFNGKVFPESPPWKKLKLSCLAWQLPS